MKKIILVLLIIGFVFILSGCTQPRISTDNSLQVVSDTKAYITVGEQMIVVDVSKWVLDSVGSISITALDGTFYKTHPANVLIVKENK